MKNKFLAVLLICLFVVLCCSSCSMGNFYDKDNRKPTGPDNPNDDPVIGPDDPSNPTADHYTAAVYLDNKPFIPDEDVNITVVWRSKNDVVRVPLDSQGKADAGKLDGNYSVYLVGLPQDYTYNPNAYVATSDERKVDILLRTITSPERGDGGNMYVNDGCYSVRDDGTYRANVSAADKTLFYEYMPRSAGVYSIESWVNVFDDAVNPQFHLYGGSTGNKWFIRTLDGGGAENDGGFCKNFRYEFAVSNSEVGSVCTFAVGGESKTGEYPLYVDFAITYLGPYSNEYSDVRPQAATQARGKTPEKKAGEEFVYADMGTKLYDASKFKISPNTGRYHVYDAEKYAGNPYGYGRGYGPMLLCDITGILPSYSVTTLYDAISVGPNNSNYLMLYNVWIEAEQKFAIYDYTNFIRVDYFGVCNSEGKCYVTEELRTFLQKFAENHSLYTDGVGAGMGTPEEAGYSANQDALWLFACGFYEQKEGN